MIKDQLQSWLDEKMDSVDLIDYFGPVYDQKPKQFSLSCGDVRMIQQISQHVRALVAKKGYAYFNGETNNRSPKSITRCEMTNDNVAELQERLFNGVLKLPEPYGDDVISLFDKDMAVVETEGKLITGRVCCVLCQIDNDRGISKRIKRKDYYSQYWNGRNWCLSNFNNRHLRRVHPKSELYEKEQHSEDGGSKNDCMST